MGIWQSLKTVIKGIFNPVCSFCGGKDEVRVHEIDKVAVFCCNRKPCQTKLKMMKKL